MKKNLASIIGLTTGFIMALLSLVSFYLLHLPIESNFNFIIYSVFSAGVVSSVLLFRPQNNETVTLKHFFNNGFKTFVIVALVMAVYTFLFFTMNTDFRENKIAENTQMIIQQGNHTPGEIKENEERLRSLFMPIMISSTVFRYLILGAIISIVTAAFKTLGFNKQLK